MPAFRCCRQRWNLADDDFILPSLVSTAARFCLFCWVLCASTYILGTFARTVNCDESCCPQQVWIVFAYLLIEVLLEISEMVVNFLILFVSASGTVQAQNEENRAKRGTAVNLVDTPGVNESRLRRLQVLLKLRVILCFPEVCISIVGLVVPFHPQLSNQPVCASSGIFQLLAAYSITAMVVSAMEMVFYLIAMNPAGCCSLGSIGYVSDLDPIAVATYKDSGRLAKQRPSIASVSLEGFHKIADGRRKSRSVHPDTEYALFNTHASHLWQKCIRSLACACGVLRSSNATNVQTSVRDVAKLFYTVFFENTSYTISDIAAAIVLVSNEQSELWRRGHLLQRRVRKKLIEQMKGNEFLCGKSNYKYQPPAPVNLSTAAEFTEVSDAIYFWRYAMAIYGWPLYLFGHPLTGCCKLCYKSLCCRCNEATYEVVAGITKANIVHCTEQNELFCSPFVVVLDHKKKALVIAIRGTLSMEDAITSMSVSLTPLYLNEPTLNRLNTQVHKGWYITANNVLNQLMQEKILDKQFEEYPDYRLIVVGHSLGGAVAAILSLLIKLNHKEHAHRLKSFGYSTPGCVFSYPLAKYCHDFVTTVVLDNDILPRLNWRSLLLLRTALKEKLETCNKPKYQVLYIDPLCAASKPTCSRESPEEEEEEIAFDEGANMVTERRVSDFVKSVYDHPDWNSLGHFSGQQETTLTLQAAVSTMVCAAKWKRKALGVANRRPSQQPIDSQEEEARKISSIPAFLPGKVLQIDTEKKRLCSWLPWPHRTQCQMNWVANEDYCLLHLHRGPLFSHLPNQLEKIFSLVQKQHMQPRQLTLVLDSVADSSDNGPELIQTMEEPSASNSQNGAPVHTNIGAREMGKLEVVVEIPSSFA